MNHHQRCNRSSTSKKKKCDKRMEAFSIKFRHRRFQNATKPFSRDDLRFAAFSSSRMRTFCRLVYVRACETRRVPPDRDGFRPPRAIESGTKRRYEDAKGVIDGFGWFMGAAGAIVVACYGVSHLY